MRSRSNQKGFTIIEVLIVLAIAALILLVVFLAIPGLQRSERNGRRRSDVAKIKLALYNYNQSSTVSSQGYNWPPESKGNSGVCFFSPYGTMIESPNFTAPFSSGLSCGSTLTADTDWFKQNILPDMSYYKNINQYFYASDWDSFCPGGGEAYGNPPATCTPRSITTLTNSNTVWIDSRSKCVGQDKIQGIQSATADNMVIAYLLENGTPQCVNVNL